MDLPTITIIIVAIGFVLTIGYSLFNISEI